MDESFFESVYRAVSAIPRGRVASYGQIACAVGRPRSSRIVGYALHRNPRPGVGPCHRVVFRSGATTPAFAFGGEDVQRALLEGEGVSFDEKGCVKPEFFVKSFKVEDGKITAE